MTWVLLTSFGQLMNADQRQRADITFNAAGQHQRARRSAIGAPGLRRPSRLAAIPRARRAGRDRGVGDDDGEAPGADQPAHRHRVLHRAARRIDEDRQAAIAERRDHASQSVRRSRDDLALGRYPFRAVGLAGRTAASDANESHRRQRGSARPEAPARRGRGNPRRSRPPAARPSRRRASLGRGFGARSKRKGGRKNISRIIAANDWPVEPLGRFPSRAPHANQPRMTTRIDRRFAALAPSAAPRSSPS